EIQQLDETLHGCDRHYYSIFGLERIRSLDYGSSAIGFAARHCRFSAARIDGNLRQARQGRGSRQVDSAELAQTKLHPVLVGHPDGGRSRRESYARRGGAAL